MVCDMSEVYKIPMVSMSKVTDELEKLKDLYTTVWKHTGPIKTVLVW